ncbi:MAG TPA: methylated-DNA--[protein]-cysteine S-methyltransferase [Sulfurovum sp.]|nr:methylated-DNA--[protein]-cysteine S-methyltransferase [Sulfurovum sp.]
MDSIAILYYESPVGELILGSYGDALCLADWRERKERAAIDSRVQKGLKALYREGESEVLKLAGKHLDEYFKGLRQTFDLPLLMVGTAFQKSVWKALRDIPFGTTLSYLELSKRIDNEKAVRAVASAVGANALSIFIPCHRIIGSDGTLRGYAGGLDTKRMLLELESGKTDPNKTLFV